MREYLSNLPNNKWEIMLKLTGYEIEMDLLSVESLQITQTIKINNPQR